MKKRLTVNVDAELIASAKRHARERGVSLSSLVEQSLRELPADGASGEPGDGSPSPAAPGGEPDEFGKAWAARWRAWFSGELPPPVRSKHPRYRYLDNCMGESYGVRWGDDDQPLDAVRSRSADGGEARKPGLAKKYRLRDGETDRAARGDEPAPSARLDEVEADDGVPFADRWYGKFKPVERCGDPRYDYLVKKYGL